MKKLTIMLTVILTVIAFSGCDWFKPPYTPPTGADANVAVYVLNSGSTSISVIDLEEDSVYNNVATVGTWPNQLVFHDGKLYCVNSGSNNITIYDVSTWEAETPIALGIGHNPMNMVIYDDATAYVSCSVSNKVLKIDLDSKTVVREMKAGVGCTGIAIANAKVYAANTGYISWDQPYMTGTVTVFNAVNGDSIKTIEVATNPQAIGVAGDGKLHVAAAGNWFDIPGAISVIDPETDAVSATYPVGSTPGSIAIDEVNNVAYCGIWGAGALAYNTATGTVVDEVFAGHGGSGVLSFDGIWISDWDADMVYKYNSEGTAVDSFLVGDSPSALAFRNEPQE
ncbi:MAG: YncE family protein [Candidatus Neomarinimicrobiota bacterium]|jgi:YVTN family beta-propeller protein|nr:YncE family protein [Candidatus Neomarinimicrobiota bacterium]MDD3966049.1 YncE family protein [Candidatus Neomarinimicrobiota bacterium]MDX9780899.1 YncE family protein [bacterium]